MQKKCKWCGKDFEPIKGNQVYCGNDCYMQMNRERQRNKAKHHNGEEITTNCVVCGRSFTYTFQSQERHICSKYCYNLHAKGKERQRYKPQKKIEKPVKSYKEQQIEKYIHTTKIVRKWWKDENGNIVYAK